MATENVNVWADGFGVWHASVPKGPSAAHIARKLIKDELQARGELRFGYVLYLVRENEENGVVTYREK